MSTLDTRGEGQAFLLRHIAELKGDLVRARRTVTYQKKRAEHWRRVALRKPVKRASRV